MFSLSCPGSFSIHYIALDGSGFEMHLPQPYRLLELQPCTLMSSFLIYGIFSIILGLLLLLRYSIVSKFKNLKFTNNQLYNIKLWRLIDEGIFYIFTVLLFALRKIKHKANPWIERLGVYWSFEKPWWEDFTSFSYYMCDQF
jgi:hypothetical protein